MHFFRQAKTSLKMVIQVFMGIENELSKKKKEVAKEANSYKDDLQ